MGATGRGLDANLAGPRTTAATSTLSNSTKSSTCVYSISSIRTNIGGPGTDRAPHPTPTLPAPKVMRLMDSIVLISTATLTAVRG